jgi:ketosteroid isomerase-like protein
VDLVKRGFELLNRGDAMAFSEFIDEVCDPEAEVTAIGRLPDVGRVRGRDAIKASRKSRTGRGSDAEPTVTALLPESERRFPLLWSAEP